MNLLRLITARGGKALDPAASAFIAAAGITDPTQKDAINQLVLDLKSYGLWSKMVAVYPFVGGSQSSCSYNLTNPAQYQLTFSGTTSQFSNSGWLNSSYPTNASNSYANTGINLNTLGYNTQNVHVSTYINSASQTSFWNRGVTVSANNSTEFSWILHTIYWADLGMISYTNNNVGVYSSAAASSPYVGLYTTTSPGSTVYGIRNNTTLASGSNGTLASYPATISNIILGTDATGKTEMFYGRYAFTSIGTGLTTTEVGNLYTAVQAFQTTLGRQV